MIFSNPSIRFIEYNSHDDENEGKGYTPGCEKWHFLRFVLDNHPQMQYTRNATSNGCQRGTFRVIQEGTKAKNEPIPLTSLRTHAEISDLRRESVEYKVGPRPTTQVAQVGKKEINHGKALA